MLLAKSAILVKLRKCHVHICKTQKGVDRSYKYHTRVETPVEIRKQMHPAKEIYLSDPSRLLQYQIRELQQQDKIFSSNNDEKSEA